MRRGFGRSSATRRSTCATTPAATSPRTARELADSARATRRRVARRGSRIAFVGHSMGGLVARSACHYASGHAWPAKVAHVFTLGTPHLGAPLEQAATATAAALARLPETRGIAQALHARSSGIKDLGDGYLVDEDWVDQDPFAFIQQSASEIPFLSCASHYFVCTTLTRELDAPVGRIIGDLLVLKPSAWSQGARPAVALPRRAVPPRRRRHPLRPAQPSSDLRADPPVAVGRPRVAGRGRGRRRPSRALSARSGRGRAQAARAARSEGAGKDRRAPTPSRRRCG